MRSIFSQAFETDFLFLVIVVLNRGRSCHRRRIRLSRTKTFISLCHVLLNISYEEVSLHRADINHHIAISEFARRDT